jgi:cytochrome c-type biogenesis protein
VLGDLPSPLLPALVVAFGGGMLSFLSPCVLPLVPGYVSLISGVSVAELQAGEELDLRRVIRSTLLFVAGFTVVFVALGATASAVGKALLHHRRVLEDVAGVLVVAMGVVLAGLAAPRALLVERRFHVAPSQVGAWGAPVMGLAFAFGWTPCIGPILTGVLTAAASEATLGRGIALLAAYSLGLGVPFLLSALALGRLSTVFSWVKRHYRGINLVSGAALAGFGVLMLTHHVTWLSTRLIDAMDRLHLSWLSRI